MDMRQVFAAAIFTTAVARRERCFAQFGCDACVAFDSACGYCVTRTSDIRACIDVTAFPDFCTKGRAARSLQLYTNRSRCPPRARVQQQPSTANRSSGVWAKSCQHMTEQQCRESPCTAGHQCCTLKLLPWLRKHATEQLREPASVANFTRYDVILKSMVAQALLATEDGANGSVAEALYLHFMQNRISSQKYDVAIRLEMLRGLVRLAARATVCQVAP